MSNKIETKEYPKIKTETTGPKFITRYRGKRNTINIGTYPTALEGHLALTKYNIPDEKILPADELIEHRVDPRMW